MIYKIIASLYCVHIHAFICKDLATVDFFLNTPDNYTYIHTMIFMIILSRNQFSTLMTVWS